MPSLSSLDAACTAHTRYGQFVVAHQQDAPYLLALLQFLERRVASATPGLMQRGTWLRAWESGAPRVLIHWPTLFEHATENLRLLAATIFPTAEYDALPSWDSGNGFTSWCTAVRQRWEQLLATLTLGPGVGEFRAMIAGYRAAQTWPPGVAEPAEFRDYDSYLVVRLVRPHLDVCRRVLVRPTQPRTLLQEHHEIMPGILQALHAAWSAVTRRHLDPYEPTEVGVDYVSSGHLLINWEVFARSRFWPTEMLLLADEATVMQHQDAQRRLLGSRRRRGRQAPLIRGAVPVPALLLPQLTALPSRLSLAAGLIDIDVAGSRRQFGRETPRASGQLCKELPFFTVTAAGQYPICTLIDPLVLTQPPLFNPRWHERQRFLKPAATRERRQELKQLLARGESHEPTSRSTVYTFTFRPADYLDDFLAVPYDRELKRARDGATDEPARLAGERCPWPFANDYTETVYAVKKRGVFCFTPPRSVRDFDGEYDVWQRFLELVHLEEAVRSAGHAFDMLEYVTTHREAGAPTLKESAYAEARDETIYQELRDLEERYRDMIARGDVGSREALAKAEEFLARQYNEATGASHKRWFFDKVMPTMTRLRFKLEELRSARRVQLPGREDAKLINFFTPRAIKEVHDCALLSMPWLLRQRAADQVLVNPQSPLAVKINTLLNEVSLRCRWTMTAATRNGAAPLLLAWTRFCQQYQVATPDAPTEVFCRGAAAPTEWTLAQDVHLLTHYRRHPQLKPAERESIGFNTGRDYATWQGRVNTWRRQLARICHPRQLQRFELGRHRFTEEEAWRVVLHWGLYQLQRGRYAKTYDRVHPPEVFRMLWRTRWEALQRLTLPTSYRDKTGFTYLSRQLLGLERMA